MAKQTWNVDRKKGGTYEFEIDAQGNYQLKKSGFGDVKSLNLPELKAEATTTTTTTTPDIKKVSDQTQKAFGDVQPFYYQGGGKDASQYTTEYEMTKDKSLDTSQPMVAGDTFAQARQKMTTDDAYLGKSTDTVTTKKADNIPAWAQDADKRGYENIGKVDTIPADKKQIGRVNVDKVLAERAQQKDLNRFPGMVGPQKPSPYQDAIMRGQTGVKYEKPGVPQKTTELKGTALKAVKSASGVLSKAVGAIMDNTLVGKVLGSFKETPTNKHDKAYFNVNENGRIAGNASTDLFAGMNRVSARGNLSQAGLNRISKRNSAKTQANLSKLSPERKAAFNAKTKEMEKQHNDYEQSRGAAATKSAKAKGLDVQNPNEMRNAGGGNSGGGGNTRVICTELHSTGEMSTRDWLRDIKFTYKDLSKEHIKGYLLWAVPTVEHIKKYPTYRKIWKHLAQHRANDIAWRLNQGKFDLLGRIYAGIGEPLCWLIGKCISDKQIKELELNNWRKT